jgi:hypothetical protein
MSTRRGTERRETGLPQAPRGASALCALVVGAAALGGCGGSDEPIGSVTGRSERIDIAAFSEGARFPANTVANAGANARAGTGPNAQAVWNLNTTLPEGVTRTGPVAASEGLTDAVATPGAPDMTGTTAAPVGPAALVDAKVGDINGKAIFAAQVLEPFAAEYRALADAMLREQPRAALGRWRADVAQSVRAELERRLRDELLRAEAVGSLTPEQRQGFRAFMQTVQRDFLSANRGSRALAEQRLARDEQMSVDEWTRLREQTELVRFQLRQRIANRVQVSWRDIRLQYDREAERFNPPATAVFRVLRIDARDEAGRAEAERLLASGTPFREVADGAFNTLGAERGRVVERAVPEDFAQGEYFGLPALNEAARGLTEGQTAGPIQTPGAVQWVHLEALRRESTPLYDAQLIIEDELLDRRRNEELARYINRLKERASFTDLDQMQARLVDIAQERYWPADAPTGASPGEPGAPPVTRPLGLSR